MQKQEQETMLTVKQIWEVLGKTVSIRQIYILIERGDLKPVYRFAGNRGTCVPREAVMDYKNNCRVDFDR